MRDAGGMADEARLAEGCWAHEVLRPLLGSRPDPVLLEVTAHSLRNCSLPRFWTGESMSQSFSCACSRAVRLAVVHAMLSLAR